MTFSDWDSGEQKFNKSVKEMTPTEILKYGDFMFTETFGFPMAIDWVKETAIMKRFVAAYKENAGPIVKWVFYKHGGRNIDREPISMGYFNSKLKWITDKYYTEMMQETVSPPVIKMPQKTGFINVRELMRMAELNGASA
jgi:hypothetical protein